MCVCEREAAARTATTRGCEDRPSPESNRLHHEHDSRKIMSQALARNQTHTRTHTHTHTHTPADARAPYRRCPLAYSSAVQVHCTPAGPCAPLALKIAVQSQAACARRLGRSGWTVRKIRQRLHSLHPARVGAAAHANGMGRKPRLAILSAL